MTSLEEPGIFKPYGLSPAQTQIALLIAAHGLTTKEIAERLGRSPKTIENHSKIVFVSCRVHTRLQLMRLYFIALLERRYGFKPDESGQVGAQPHAVNTGATGRHSHRGIQAATIGASQST